MTGRRFALIAGGGTAGHLQPALAIAEALVDGGRERTSIGFLGSSRGQDAAVLADRGFPADLLPGRGIVRSMAPRALLQNLGALWGLAVAAVRAQAIVRRDRPQVVVAVGGYASLAGALAAVLQRIPLVLVNIDAVPGAANRLFGRFASASVVGWPGTALPRATVTGTPVRPAVAAVVRTPEARTAARAALGLPSDGAVVAAFGGSLGARRINGAVDGLAAARAGRDDVAVYHIIGRRDWPSYGPDDGAASPASPASSASPAGGALPSGSGPVVVRVPYEERMDLVYAAADLVVCRAGAMTVAELAAAGVPAVLVPLPGAPGDHQTANAGVLERAGAAVLLPDPECTGGRLAEVVDGLLADPVRLAAMGAAAAAEGRPDAAAAGARVVEAAARTSRGAA